jgi:hypothetical protein
MFSVEDTRHENEAKPDGFDTVKEAYQASLDLVGHKTFRTRSKDVPRDKTRYYAIGYRNGRETLEGPRSWCYFDRSKGYTL